MWAVKNYAAQDGLDIRGGGMTCPTLNRIAAVAAGYVIIDYKSIHLGLSLFSRPGNFPSEMEIGGEIL